MSDHRLDRFDGHCSVVVLVLVHSGLSCPAGEDIVGNGGDYERHFCAESEVLTRYRTGFFAQQQHVSETKALVAPIVALPSPPKPAVRPLGWCL